MNIRTVRHRVLAAALGALAAVCAAAAGTAVTPSPAPVARAFVSGGSDDCPQSGCGLNHCQVLL